MMEKKQNKQPSPLRLNKVLAQHGLCSRRRADDWIHEGRVAIDGIVCREVGKIVDPSVQRISVDGQILECKPPAVYIALNKPVGVVSTCSDPQGRTTVIDFLDDHLRACGLFPVGRLDSDSEGLMLLTNDGEWNQLLLHPSHQVWKVYQVTADKDLNPNIKNKLERGIAINGKRTLPAKIRFNTSQRGKNCFDIEIREGRNRQIRRMLARCGLLTISLKRIKIGPVSLGNLAPGKWRYLEENEIQSIRDLQENIENPNPRT